MLKLEKETRLKLAIFLSLIFMCIEIAGGYLANSIAIFSDAAHLLTDIAGFIIALIATIAAKSPGTKTLTFGMARAEVFGALGSVMSLWVITAFLLYAAFFRAVAWFEGTAESVDGFLMFSVACFGVLVNLCLGYVFHEDHGGAFHPSHSHDHGHSCSGGHGHHEAPSHSGYQQVSTEQSQPAKKVEAAGHDHSHDHKSKGSDHSHSHEHTETTPLLPNVGSTGKPAVKTEPFAFTKAAKCTGHAHDSGSHRLLEATPDKPAAAPASKCASNGHDHSHDHHSHAAHDHSERDIESARIKEDDHGHDHGHAHSSYGSSGGHTDSHDHGAHSGHAHHASDVNLEAAYLHVLTDLIQSVGVAIAGAVLWWRPDWQIIDPVCTVLFSIVALNSTLPLINKVAMILFEGTPAHVSTALYNTALYSLY